ncbi:MAG: hypothetical protein ACU841_09585, partial [Gammaproteobacteria bacterium]
MASVEIIAGLFAGCVNYQRVGGSNYSEMLSQAELAGLLSGLNRPQMDLAFARYGCDAASERRLIA